MSEPHIIIDPPLPNTDQKRVNFCIDISNSDINDYRNEQNLPRNYPAERVAALITQELISPTNNFYYTVNDNKGHYTAVDLQNPEDEPATLVQPITTVSYPAPNPHDLTTAVQSTTKDALTTLSDDVLATLSEIATLYAEPIKVERMVMTLRKHLREKWLS